MCPALSAAAAAWSAAAVCVCDDEARDKAFGAMTAVEGSADAFVVQTSDLRKPQGQSHTLCLVLQLAQLSWG